MLKQIAVFSNDLSSAIEIINKLLEFESVIESKMDKFYYEVHTADARYATEIYNPRMYGMVYDKIWIDSESNVTKAMVSRYLDSSNINNENAIEFFVSDN